MSDLGPNELQEGIEATGYIAAFLGAMSAMFIWIFKRQINRLDVIEKEYVPNDRHDKAIDHLNERVSTIEEVFRAEHKTTRKEMRDNIDGLTKTIISLMKKD